MNDYDTPEIRCSLRNLSRVTECLTSTPSKPENHSQASGTDPEEGEKSVGCGRQFGKIACLLTPYTFYKRVYTQTLNKYIIYM